MAQQYVAVQLDQSRMKQKLVLKLSWLIDADKIQETLNKSAKYTEPVYCFYHEDENTVPILSASIFKETFDPTVAAVYKGYLLNKIYGRVQPNLYIIWVNPLLATFFFSFTNFICTFLYFQYKTYI